ncbi:MAG: penicillin-binding protein 2 [Pyrinomonadaceae bacterium]|nr:penicillin-binding protein 2 [Pyrinomonadaceae bacterium]
MTARAKKITKQRNPTQTAFTRFMLIVAFFILWIGGIGVRLVHLQINQSEWLRDKAQNQRRDELKSKTLRGTIYDRTERALAMSVKVKSLYADPREIEDIAATAQKLAPILKIKQSEILENLRIAKENNKRFVWLARKIDEDTALKLNLALEMPDLKKFDLPKFSGLHWREEQKRSYPYKNLAAQVVGFSNADDIGQAGIEQSQEEILRGATVNRWQDRDRLGRVYDEETEQREPPKDIVLTINNSIQFKVEQALEKGAKASNSKAGMAIVLEQKTGEVLAMANYPTFDPNRYTEFAAENYQNKAIQSIYSPGSVFKLVTYGSAIEDGSINPNGMIDCRNGFIEVAGRRFNDPHATKVMSYSEALAVSSNVAAIKTGLGLGKDKFYGYARKFGFGQPIGIELPAEARGQFRSPDGWFGDSLASMSIGYEVGVTALQMVSAYATIANDGVRVKPHIIKEIRFADGKPFSVTDAEKTPIVTAETARGLRRMLREVVLKGTAKRAQLNGYTSAGKTGTAWKYNAKLKRVDAGKYVSSFIGMAPADNPAVVILVVMDEPRGGARDGGQVSAPVFREIAEGILPEMNVAPDGQVAPDNLTAENIPSEVEADVALPQTEQTTKTEVKEDVTSATTKKIKPSVESDTEKKEIKSVGKNEKIEKPGKIKEVAENKKDKKENTKEKKEIKQSGEDKKSSKPKTADANKEKPKADLKNKSLTEKVKKKT